MRTINLSDISEDHLLNLRICDLPLSIQGTWIEECIEELYIELQANGLCFKPICYLADEWLTPLDEPVIGIPFYLAHPALVKLEKKMMLEAEGGTREWCMRLLRHEAGHAISYAFRFHKKKKWKETFGSPSREYSENYRFHPYSKNFVRHLEGFYAQFHPDEDFVETFAVWLTPHSQWSQRYQGWKAIEKLKFVDQVMSDVKGKEPLVKTGKEYWHFKHLRITLKNFYKKKRHLRAEDFPDFHDDNLRKIFIIKEDLTGHAGEEKDKAAAPPKPPLAADILRKYKKNMLSDVSRWTGEKKYVVNDLFKTIYQRCRELKLYAKDEEGILLLRISSYLTTLVMNYVYTGWYRGDKRKRKK